MLSRTGSTLMLALVASAALAQQGQINLSGGTGTDVLGVTSTALSVAPSLTLSSDPRASFALGGSGTRFNNNAWALAGRVAAAFRAPLADWAALTLNGSATGTA